MLSRPSVVHLEMIFLNFVRSARGVGVGVRACVCARVWGRARTDVEVSSGLHLYFTN